MSAAALQQILQPGGLQVDTVLCPRAEQAPPALLRPQAIHDQEQISVSGAVCDKLYGCTVESQLYEPALVHITEMFV